MGFYSIHYRYIYNRNILEIKMFNIYYTFYYLNVIFKLHSIIDVVYI